ncbi:MAG: hypothetical protein ACO3IN_06890 [Steroidobacteraceae bacterium]
MTESQQRGTGKGWWLAIGLVLVAGAAWFGNQPRPASDEAAGTIMQAQRHHAESTPAVEAASEADEATTEGLSAEQLAEPEADQTDADRAQASEAAKALNTGNTGPPCPSDGSVDGC